MPLVDGLRYTIDPPCDNKIQNLPHDKGYIAQAKSHMDKTLFGYRVIKVKEPVTIYTGWRAKEMKTETAQPGQYLVQTMGQPPIIIESWKQLRAEYKVFQNQTI